MSSCSEILGLRTLALYVNKDVILSRPDISKEDEIDIIAHAEGTIVVESLGQPKWNRKVNYSGNYKEIYTDTFTFFLHGLNDNTKLILNQLRIERKGFIPEAVTVGGESFVFPTPIYVSKIYEKKEDLRTWAVEMTYRKPTFQDKLTKLNTLLMTSSYILTADNQILGTGNNIPIVSN